MATMPPIPARKVQPVNAAIIYKTGSINTANSSAINPKANLSFSSESKIGLHDSVSLATAAGVKLHSRATQLRGERAWKPLGKAPIQRVFDADQA
jgi:hypothetical protein